MLVSVGRGMPLPLGTIRNHLDMPEGWARIDPNDRVKHKAGLKNGSKASIRGNGVCRFLSFYVSEAYGFDIMWGALGVYGLEYKLQESGNWEHTTALGGFPYKIMQWFYRYKKPMATAEGQRMRGQMGGGPEGMRELISAQEQLNRDETDRSTGVGKWWLSDATRSGAPIIDRIENGMVYYHMSNGGNGVATYDDFRKLFGYAPRTEE